MPVIDVDGDVHTASLDAAAEMVLEQLKRGENPRMVFHGADAHARKAALKKKLKAAGYDLEGDKMSKTLAEKTVKRTKKIAKTSTQNTGGPGLGTPSIDPDASVSAESNAILKLVSGEAPAPVQAAKAVFLDPKASPAAKRTALTVVKGFVQDALRGEDLDVMPVGHDANDVGVVGGTVSREYVAKCEKAVAEAESDVEKEEAGNALTLARLKRLHAQSKARRARVAKSIDPEPIAQLRELVKDPDLDPAVKMQAAETITKHDLVKSAYDDQLAATNALVRETQARITANPQSASGADARAQVAAIGSGDGSPESLGTPQNVGTSKPGYITGREIVDPEPTAHVTGQHEDVFTKQRRGEEQTLANLRKLHGG